MTTRYWQQLEFPLPGHLADAATDLVEAMGALSVSSEASDASDRFDLAEPTLQHFTAARLSVLFDDSAPLEPVIAALARVFDVAPADCAVTRLADRDWERAWLERYRPIRITPELWVCPSWCEPPADAAVVVTLDPGMAFGTGTHATTALCLERLAGMDLAGRRVLDFGCGSGILAIAAVRLGAAHAVACDVDPRALEATRTNAALNGVATQVETVPAAQASEKIAGGEICADVVIANILAHALVELSDTLVRALTPGGSLLLSGILADQRGQVAGAYPEFDFKVYPRDEWILMAT